MLTIKKIPIAVMILLPVFSLSGQKMQLNTWLTNADRSASFQQQPAMQFSKTFSNGYPTIAINEKETYQTIDGFGFALTGGCAQHLIKMTATARAALLKELFTSDNSGIGISYLRLSIGASDLNEKIFSYDDLPEGETDPEMKKFDLGPDQADVIRVLKEILELYPTIKILGSPWSPPVWMKTIHDTRGGRLSPEFYNAYARYFVKYIRAMKAEGIVIDAVTVQNEPLHPGNNPSLLLPAPDEAEFIKNFLGPAFEAAGITTKIIIYDHNADRPDYPISILNDTAAAKFIDGSGFHLYGGSIETLTEVHDAHPDKQLYFTEQMMVDWPGSKEMNIAEPVKDVLIGATRNWCRNVLLWNLAADRDYKPYTDRGGCSGCQGAVTIDGDSVFRNLAYYAMAHISKFVRPGSVRIASPNMDSLANVAFKTPHGKIALLVANTGKSEQTFNILYKSAMITTKLKSGSVATYVW